MRHWEGFALQFVLLEQHLKNHRLVLYVKPWAPKGMDSGGVGKKICRVGSNDSRQASLCLQELRQGWHWCSHFLTKLSVGISWMRRCLPIKCTITLKQAKLGGMISYVCCTLQFLSISAFISTKRHNLWFGTEKSLRIRASVCSFCLQISINLWILFKTPEGFAYQLCILLFWKSFFGVSQLNKSVPPGTLENW